MTMERRNPVPPGRYWVDILIGKLTAFDLMLDREKGNVVVEQREEFPNPQNFDASVTHFIFTNKKPLKWEQGWGYPTIAGPQIQSSADTVSKPPPEPGLGEQLSTMLGDAKTILFIAALGWAFTQSRKR